MLFMAILAHANIMHFMGYVCALPLIKWILRETQLASRDCPFHDICPPGGFECMETFTERCVTASDAAWQRVAEITRCMASGFKL